MERVISLVNDIVWNPALVVLLLAQAPELGNNYVGYTQAAVDTVFNGLGGKFISVAMVFSTFSTLLAYYFYSESSIIYLFRNRYPKAEKLVIRVFQAVMIAMVVFGAVREADLVWKLGDIGVGMMAWGTVVAILFLCPQALKSLKDFENQLKS